MYRTITINLSFYYLHTYIDTIYYHVPFYFIESINSKNEKRKYTMYNSLLELLLLNKVNITNCILKIKFHF